MAAIKLLGRWRGEQGDSRRGGCRPGAAVVVALLATGEALPALDPNRALTQHIHEVWQGEEGLPQNTVNAIAQTTDGYVWVGTQEGLARFDGVRFVVFDRRNTPQLSNQWINALAAAPDGSLWIGTRGGGLVHYANGSFTAYTTDHGLSDNRVRALYIGQRGDLWIGTSGGGLNRWRDSRFSSLRMADGLPSDEIVALHEDRSGDLWIGTFGGGLARLRDGKVEVFGRSEGLSDMAVSALAEDAHGVLWVGTFSGGLNRFADGVFTVIDRSRGLSSDQVWTVAPDSAGNLWIGTSDGGLNRLRDGKVTVLDQAHGLSSDTVLAVREDREGSLWLGTAGGGLSRLRDGPFVTYSTREGLPSDVVLTVLEDSEDNVWIGTDGGGLTRMRGGQVTTFTSADGLPNETVASLAEDATGGLWVGTLGGLVHSRRSQPRRFEPYPGLADEVVVALYRDRGNNLWVGTDGDGVSRLSADGVLTKLGTEDGLAQTRVGAILEDRTGTVWLGTSGGGLQHLVTAGNRVAPPVAGLASGHVAALLEGQAGELWIGTSGGGLMRLLDRRVTTLDSRSGLHDDRIFGLLEDRRGALWMSSNRGVFRLDRDALLAFLDGRSERVEPMVFGVADGMRSAECNGENQPSVWRTRDGRLWFPTIRGVAVVDPERIPPEVPPARVLVEEVLADGKPLVSPAAGSLALVPGTGRLEIRYTATGLVVPQRARFRVLLEGYDADWVETHAQRVAHYGRLPPGDYRLRVQARNGSGEWVESPSTLALIQLPFFYQTTLFRLAAAALLVGIGALAQRLRVRQLRHRAAQLERIVETQTQDLRSANSELERAQSQLDRMLAARPEKLEDVATWGGAMAVEIARTIGAAEVEIHRLRAGEWQTLSGSTAVTLSAEEERVARSGGGTVAGAIVVPVVGMTAQTLGALVVRGGLRWGDVERRLVGGLAQHLGTALELRELRNELTQTAARQAAVRDQMTGRGVATLKICRSCRRCYDQTADYCSEDGAALDESLLLPYRALDRYRLQTLLGEGGMGVVFEAQDEKLERKVALKVIQPRHLTDSGARFRLEREARTLAQTHHPSIVELFDTGELEDGSSVLVMEYLAGWDLENVLYNQGAGAPRQIAALLRQVAAGLAAAHNVGVIHRDIKPANIFVVPDRSGFHFKVLDFGLALRVETESRLTQVGVVVGTAQYMSPEQLEGHAIDARTDLYSLATVVFEALSGRRVVVNEELSRAIVEVLFAPPPKLSTLVADLPIEIEVELEKALAKRPQNRPSDLESWANGLADRLESLPLPRHPGWCLPRERAPTPQKAAADRWPTAAMGQTRPVAAQLVPAHPVAGSAPETVAHPAPTAPKTPA